MKYSPEKGYAGFWKRLTAGMIDLILIFLFSGIFSLMYGIAAQIIGINIDPFIYFKETNMLMGILYVNGLLISHQATIGMSFMCIRLTDISGNPTSAGEVIVRYFAQIFLSSILGIGYFMIGWTKKKQALHDKIATTLVVNK